MTEPLHSRDKVTDSILILEGPDDFHFFNALLDDSSCISLKNRVHRTSPHGVVNAIDGFELQLKVDSITSLGLVIDADEDINSRWDQVKQILSEAKYSDIPDSPNPSGLVLSNTQTIVPKVGVWIMPNNKLSGSLEDFFKLIIPKKDTLIIRAARSVKSIKSEKRLFKEQHFTKAVIHTWLAWQELPGEPMGRAITKNYLNIDSLEAQSLIGWLHSLYLE